MTSEKYVLQYFLGMDIHGRLKIGDTCHTLVTRNCVLTS